MSPASLRQQPKRLVHYNDLTEKIRAEVDTRYSDLVIRAECYFLLNADGSLVKRYRPLRWALDRGEGSGLQLPL